MTRRRVLVGASALALLGLGAALALVWARGDIELPRPEAPLSIRGGVVIEPPELTIGETATVEVDVVTPPEHRMEPLAAPAGVEGLWVLAAEELPVEMRPGHWIHRTRFLVRARATGDLLWPEQIAFVDPPNGARVPVALAARPLRVVEVSRELPDRQEPFSFRTPEPPPRSVGFLLPALFGAGTMLAALALVAVVRRSRRRARAAEGAIVPAPPPGVAQETIAALDAADARIDADAVAAADAASVALRAYVARRTGAPARVATTEELLALPVPFLLARHWPALLAALQRLDGARFRAGGLASGAARDALRAELRAARALVENPAPGAPA